MGNKSNNNILMIIYNDTTAKETCKHAISENSICEWFAFLSKANNEIKNSNLLNTLYMFVNIYSSIYISSDLIKSNFNLSLEHSVTSRTEAIQYSVSN